MTDRIIGPTGSKRRKRFLIASILTIACTALFMTVGAQAIHNPGDTSLELDGNVADNPAGAPDDWNNFFPSAPADVSFTTGIVPDPEPQTIFTGAQAGGSSKDNQDISGWRWKCGSVPPKDEIADAASAIYNVGTEQRLYFMSDREAVNGDSHLGVWFMKKSLTTVPTPPTCPNGAHPFSDIHSVGDILVLSDFTQGGTISNIKVFKWVGTGGTEPKSNGTLDRIGLGTDCIGLVHNAGDPELCGTVNSALLGPGNGADGIAGTNDDGPAWPYTPASGANGSMPPGSFFEGGIDLGTLGLTGVCFGSVLTETRSSSEIDAVLKDFVLHAFEPCTSGLTTQASASVPVGGSISDTATVTGSGAGNPTGTVTFTVCGPFPTATACTSSDATAAPAGTRTLQVDGTLGNPAIVTSDSIVTTGTGYYCFLAHYSGDIHYPAKDENSTGTECVQVVTVPTAISTAQFVYPNDTATVSTGTGTLPTGGTVLFKAYIATAAATAQANCNANGATGLLDSETVNITGGSATELVTTANTTHAIPPQTIVYWRVLYTSNSTGYENRQSVCAEHTDVTFTDDSSGGSKP
jgi:hypothetical protein